MQKRFFAALLIGLLVLSSAGMCFAQQLPEEAVLPAAEDIAGQAPEASEGETPAEDTEIPAQGETEVPALPDNTQPDWRSLFLSNYALPDAHAMELARMPVYDTSELAKMKNVYYFPAYHNSAPRREMDFRYKPVTAWREQIFKVYGVKNPNYVSCFLAQNRLCDLIEETPQYAVPVAIGDSTGVVFYQRGTDEGWQYCGYSRFWIPFDGGMLFDTESVQEELERRSMEDAADIKFLRFSERHLFLYVRDTAGQECLLSLTSDGFLGEFGGDYLADFDTLIPQYGASVNSTAPDLPCGGFQFDKKDYTAQAVELQGMGLFSGDEDGYRLLDTPTRIQALVMVVRARGGKEQAEQYSGSSGFSDIPDGHWAAGYAGYAREMGLTNGLGDGTFAPDQSITQREFLTLLLRGMGYDAPSDPFALWQMAFDVGLIENAADFPPYEQADNLTDMDVAGELKALFTRGDMVKLVHTALNCFTADGQYLWQKIWW